MHANRVLSGWDSWIRLANAVVASSNLLPLRAHCARYFVYIQLFLTIPDNKASGKHVNSLQLDIFRCENNRKTISINQSRSLEAIVCQWNVSVLFGCICSLL